MAISNDSIRKKPVDTFCVKQSGTPKYIVHLLRGAASKKYRQEYDYDTPKYVIHVLGGAVSKTYRRLPDSRKYRKILLVDS